jgi:DNA repair protein RecN (Recombination protein N)
MPPAGCSRPTALRGREAGEIVIRRIQNAEGGSRAFVNDQPVSVGLLRQLGGLLAEIHGQHDERALMDMAGHRRLLDAFAGLEPAADAVAAAWSRLAEARAMLDDERAKLERAAAEREFLDHAVAELARLAPQAGEEERLADARQLMMNAEGLVAAVHEAGEALDAGKTLEASLNAVLRKLERRREAAAGHFDEVAAALERVLVEMTEARSVVAAAERGLMFDPRELEAAEERLFALRAAARKHNVPVDELAAVQARFEAALRDIDDGERRLAETAGSSEAGRGGLFRRRGAAFGRAPGGGWPARQGGRGGIGAAQAGAGPLCHRGEERSLGGRAQRPRPGRVQGGGEPRHAARRSGKGRVGRRACPLRAGAEGGAGQPRLGPDPDFRRDRFRRRRGGRRCGGPAAGATGGQEGGLQVLAVTHSPQVAARADGHFLISKAAQAGADAERSVTRVMALMADSRREEIARMLSGASITEEARAQAERLIGQTG